MERIASWSVSLAWLARLELARGPMPAARCKCCRTWKPDVWGGRCSNCRKLGFDRGTCACTRGRIQTVRKVPGPRGTYACPACFPFALWRETGRLTLACAASQARRAALFAWMRASRSGSVHLWIIAPAKNGAKKKACLLLLVRLLFFASLSPLGW